MLLERSKQKAVMDSKERLSYFIGSFALYLVSAYSVKAGPHKTPASDSTSCYICRACLLCTISYFQDITDINSLILHSKSMRFPYLPDEKTENRDIKELA